MIGLGYNNNRNGYSSSASQFVSPRTSMSPITYPEKTSKKVPPSIVQTGVGIAASIVGAIVLKKFVGPAVGKAVSNAAKKGTGAIGRAAAKAARSGMLRGDLNDVYRLSSTFRNVEKKVTGTFSTYKKAYDTFQNANENVSTMRKMYRFWSPSKTGEFTRNQRVVGALYKNAMDNIELLPMSYAIDRATNVGGYERPEWYDVKGNVKDFANYAITDIVFDSLRLGAQGVVGFGGRKLLSQISKHTNSDFGRQVLENATKTGGKLLNKVRASERSVRSTLRELDKNPTRFLPIKRNTNHTFGRYNYRPTFTDYKEKMKNIYSSLKYNYNRVYSDRQKVKPDFRIAKDDLRRKTFTEDLKDFDKVVRGNRKKFTEDTLSKYKKGNKTIFGELFGITNTKFTDRDMGKAINIMRDSGIENETIQKIKNEGLFYSKNAFDLNGEVLDVTKLSMNDLLLNISKKMDESRYGPAMRMLGVSGFINSRVKKNDIGSIKVQSGQSLVGSRGDIYGSTVKRELDGLETYEGVSKYTVRNKNLYRMTETGTVELLEENIRTLYSPGMSWEKKIMSDLAKVKNDLSSPDSRYYKDERDNNLFIKAKNMIGNSSVVKAINNMVGKEKKITSIIKQASLHNLDPNDPKDIYNTYKTIQNVSTKYMREASDIMNSEVFRKNYGSVYSLYNKGPGIFDMDSNQLLSKLTDYVEINKKNSKNIHVDRVRKFLDKIHVESELLETAPDEMLLKYQSNRTEANALGVFIDMNDMQGDTDSILGALGKGLGADEQAVLKNFDVFTNMNRITNFTDENIANFAADFNKLKRGSLGEFADYLKSENFFGNVLEDALKIDSDREKILGASLPYIITKDESGIDNMIKATANLFGFGKQLSGMDDVTMTPNYMAMSKVSSVVKKLATNVGFGPGSSKGEPYLAHENMRFIARRSAQLAGLAAGYFAIDTLVDEVLPTEGTAFDEGLTVFAAEKVAQSQLALASIRDITGINKAGQYLEGLMPDSTTLIPSVIAGGIAGASAGPFGPIVGAVFGLGLGKIGREMGALDFTTTREDLEAQMSGRELVPHKRHRWWLLSMEPFSGTGTEYYKPHWFHRIKSQYEYTPSGKGSKLDALIHRPLPGIGINPIGQVLDPYGAERRHYYTRPEPYTGRLFKDIPVVGEVYSMSSKILKPQTMMHQNMLEMAQAYDQPPENPAKPGSLSSIGSSFIREAGFEVSGFRGYQAEFASGLLGLRKRLEYSEAGDDYSLRKSYWDAGTGDIFFTGGSELLRRFLPSEMYDVDYNPIPNVLSGHIPSNMRSGNPFANLKDADRRLPGLGLEAVRDVRHAFPSSSSRLGSGLQESIVDMLGAKEPSDDELFEMSTQGTMIHHQIQTMYQQQGRLVEAEQMVYDAENDIVGFIDAIVKNEAGYDEVVEIKTYEGAAPSKAKYKHVHQINFYLAMKNAKQGTIRYHSREDPSQFVEHKVYFNPSMLKKDISTIKHARRKALRALKSGAGLHTGASYSWLDRFKILSDIGSTSDEYKTAERIVNAQISHGKLSDEEIQEYIYFKQLRNKVLHRYDTHPYRFRGDRLATETPLLEEYEVGSSNETYATRVYQDKAYLNLYNDNKYMRPAETYNILERAVGGMYENITHAPTAINRKFINQYSAAEMYEYQNVYGDAYQPWDEPYKSWIKPQMQKIRGGRTVLASAWHGATTGYAGTMGSPVGALVGAAGGAATHAVESARRGITGNRYIPKDVQDREMMNLYADQMKYVKSKIGQAYGDPDSYDEMRSTLRGAQTRSDMFRAMPRPEKSYLADMLAESSPGERKRIMGVAPGYLKEFLAQEWGSNFSDVTRSKLSENMPVNWSSDWAGWDSTVQAQDIQAAVVSNEGYSMHDYGLGYGMDRYKYTDKYLEEVHPQLSDGKKAIHQQPDVNGIMELVQKVVAGNGKVKVSGGNSSNIQVVIE